MVCKLNNNNVLFMDLPQGAAFSIGGIVYMKTMPIIADGKTVFNTVNLSSGDMVTTADNFAVRRLNMECKEV